MTLPAQDIVERLRAWAGNYEEGSFDTEESLMTEAADTISRLTADNEALRKERDQAQKEVDALLQSAARKGDEPDLLISEWHDALDRAERAEEAAAITIDQAKADEARATALEQALRAIKARVSGDRAPNWNGDTEVTRSRFWLANVIDTALANEEAGR